jgi:hypothetical protein
MWGLRFPRKEKVYTHPDGHSKMISKVHVFKYLVSNKTRILPIHPKS